MWTIVNIWGMATFYQRGYRRNKMLSTLFATQKHEAIQRTMWALSPWQSKFSSSYLPLKNGACDGPDVIVQLSSSLLLLMDMFNFFFLVLLHLATVRSWPHWHQILAASCPNSMLSNPKEKSPSAQGSGWLMCVTLKVFGPGKMVIPA